MAMASAAPLEASYAACTRIMRANASTFSLATRLLPAERRRATTALYGLFRTLDDLVDTVAAGARARAEALAELRRWRAWLADAGEPAPDHPVVPAFADTLRRWSIDRAYFVQLTYGLEDDLEDRRYATFTDLALYCYRVASTVGLAMCSVLGVSDDEACGYAAELGVAMQLTNILRDVREDAGNGRVYLPWEELRLAGWDEERLLRGGVDEPFRALMRRQVGRARSYYARGMAGLPYLSPDARFAILVAARAYGGILGEIERRDYDVFAGRARVSTARKLGVVVGSYLTRRRFGEASGAGATLPAGEPTGLDLIGAAAER